MKSLTNLIAITMISASAALAEPADRAVTNSATTLENCGPGAVLREDASHHSGVVTVGEGAEHCTIKFKPRAFSAQPPCFARWRTQVPPILGGAPIVTSRDGGGGIVVALRDGAKAFTYFCSAVN